MALFLLPPRVLGGGLNLILWCCLQACLRPEVDKFTLKSNGDEALSAEFLLKSNGDEAFNDVFP
jgi:hypothetical protein